MKRVVRSTIKRSNLKETKVSVDVNVYQNKVVVSLTDVERQYFANIFVPFLKQIGYKIDFSRQTRYVFGELIEVFGKYSQVYRIRYHHLFFYNITSDVEFGDDKDDWCDSYLYADEIVALIRRLLL